VKLRVLDLFSGIGGFSLGLERTGGFETVAFCEIEPYPRAVLAKHWPGVPIYDDVRTLTADALRRDGIAVDVICGGFPCQDISWAGKGAGITGERSGLWREYARIICELEPAYVIMENVSALLARGLGDVLGDLAKIGYDAEWHCIPASAIGAPHERDRIWIVGYPNSEPWFPEVERIQITGYSLANQGAFWGGANEPPFHGVAYGVPYGSQRCKAIGNAVVPQIPELIGRAILAAERAAA
jgi:DNA (cytosine-5)-methyltransferase 1